MGNTHVARLKQSGARLFWDLDPLTGYQGHGADTSNAFAEASPPIALLCITIDEQNRNGNNHHWKLQHALENSVLPMIQALQGHPESLRLWDEHMHKIILLLHFKNFSP